MKTAHRVAIKKFHRFPLDTSKEIKTTKAHVPGKCTVYRNKSFAWSYFSRRPNYAVYAHQG
jgi:hypothetical protein